MLKSKKLLPGHLAIIGFFIAFPLIIFSAFRLFSADAEELISPLPSRLYTPAKIKVEAEEPENADSIIAEVSKEYDVPKYMLHCVLFYESRYRTDRIGDNGKAIGPAQFHLSTWIAFRKEMGKSTADDRTDFRKSAETLAWAISEGKGSHWSPIADGRCWVDVFFEF